MRECVCACVRVFVLFVCFDSVLVLSFGGVTHERVYYCYYYFEC